MEVGSWLGGFAARMAAASAGLSAPGFSYIGKVATAIHALAQGEPVQWELVIAQLITGVGLITSRDADKSSEDSQRK